MKSTTLPRAVLLTLAWCLMLGVAALAPSRPWVTPRRPPLKAPVVFDELQNLPSPAVDPAAASRAP